jgi:hypothetical protein
VCAGGPTTPVRVVDAALRDDPSDDLVPPRGALVVAVEGDADLVEARRRYSRLGCAEVPAFNRGRYAEHRFATTLV